jgi:hypothetical protein
VPQGAGALDKAWSALDKLNEIVKSDLRWTDNEYKRGYGTALYQAISIIESLGGCDPLKRGKL